MVEKEPDPIWSEEKAAEYDNGLSKSQRNKLIARGEYPLPVRSVPNGRKRGFLKSEILAYHAKLIAARTQPFTAIKRGAKGRMVKA